MKIFKRFLIISVMILFIFTIMTKNISVNAAGPVSEAAQEMQVESDVKTESVTTTLQSIVGRVLAYIQIIAGIFAVIATALTGFNYLVATPEVKGDIKKKMLPLVLGIVFIFGASSIAQFILSAFE